MKAIRETAKRGCGKAINEAELGVSAAAAAIRIQPDGSGAGTVSVAGPSLRITPERMKALAPVVRDYAARLAAIWPLRHKPGVPRISA